MKRSKIIIDWVEEHLRVPEGKYVGQPIKLRPMQVEIIEGIYDQKKPLVRRALISVGRKNTKTATSAILLLVHLCGPEARQNSDLFSAAQSRDQAGILFNLAAKMVRMSPDISTYVIVRDHAKQLHCRELGTLYRALSAEASTAYGLSPVFVVHDELGQVKGPRSELYDALETAAGAQENPLSIIISTQSPTDADLLSILIDDAVAEEDPRTKVFLWTAPMDDDPFNEKTWKKANPMLGDVLNIDEVRDQAEQARRMPSREAAFRNLVLNQRIDQTSPLIPRAVWMACAGETDIEVLRRGPTYFALDLSARHDLTALAAIAQDDEGVWHVSCDFFVPGKNLDVKSRTDRVPYDVWVKEGYVTATPGASVDYEVVARRLCEWFDDTGVVASVAFDRWRMDVLIKELERLGAVEVIDKLVPFGQGFKDMAPAVDAVEAALASETVRHGNNKALNWCAANAVAVTDPAGNRKLDKAKSTGRIDGFVALTMCFGVASSQPEVMESVYETRGLMEVGL